MKKLVISGFPGIGKSWLFKNPKGQVVRDSDSSNFSWLNQAEQIRHPDWPSNYMEHIWEKRESADFTLVSTHKEVRDAMVKAAIPFVLVYPALDMKEEYIERYVVRGNAPFFVSLLTQNYDTWISELQAQKNCLHVVLSPGQYLADVLVRLP